MPHHQQQATAAAQQSSTLICLTPIILALGFMLVAGLADWPYWQKAFRSDFSSVSWLSSAQLWSLALLSLMLIAIRGLPLGLGGLLVSCFVLLALDEQFQWHELWKYRCIDWLALCRFKLVTEAPLLIVGAGGSALVYLLLQQAPDRRSKLLLLSSLGIGLIALGVDQLPMPAAIAVFEEALEVLAEACWISYLFSLAIGARHRGD
jgi:hypothetical protein